MTRYWINISVALCIVFVLFSSGFCYIGNYLDKAQPSMHGKMFVPVNVRKVSPENDVTVTAHKVTLSHAPENTAEMKLNEISKARIVNMYQERCRIVFDYRDSSLKDTQTGEDPYWYAEIVPRNRLMVTDMFAKLKDDSTDTLAADYKPQLYEDSLRISWGAISNGYRIFVTVIANAAVITFTVIINVVITKAVKKHER